MGKAFFKQFKLVTCFTIFSLIFQASAALAYINVLSNESSSSFDFTLLENARFDYIMGFHRKFEPLLVGQYTYANKPLIEVLPNGRRNTVVSSIHSIGTRLGLLLHSRLMFDYAISANSVRLGTGVVKYGLGDSELQMKYRLTTNSEPLAVSIVPQVYFPTGDRSIYLSNNTIGWALMMSADRTFGMVKLAANLGFRNFGNGAKQGSIDFSNQIIAGIGAELLLNRRWSINAETIGEFAIPAQKINSPGEYYLGATYRISSSEQFYAGVDMSGSPGVVSFVPGVVVGFKMLPFPAKVKTESQQPTQNVVPPGQSAGGQNCAPKPFTVAYFSRALNNEELQDTLLPYLNLKNKKIHERINTIRLGYMTGMTDNGIPWVQNAQIPFGITMIDLPPRASVVSLDQAILKMNVKKVSKDPYLSTEIFCFADLGICSGDLISDGNWKSLLNQRFFKGKATVANNFFSQKYLGHAVGKVAGQKIYAADLSLDLESLLKKSGLKPIDLIYGNQPANLPIRSKTLKMVVADDTFIGTDARLEIMMTIKQCN